MSFTLDDRILLIGFGGHAESMADTIIKLKKYHIAGYTDIKDNHCQFDYLGNDDQLENIYKRGIRKAAIGIGCMGDSRLREKVIAKAKGLGFVFPAIIDPTAIIASDIEVGEGTYIGKRAVINAGAKVGEFCIINTGCIVEHDNCIGDFSHVAVGATLCGSVKIGARSFIGAGAVVIQTIQIGDDVLVGANSTILSDITNNEKVYGVYKHKNI